MGALSLCCQPEDDLEEISTTSDILDTLLNLVEREEREVKVISLICGENRTFSEPVFKSVKSNSQSTGTWISRLHNVAHCGAHFRGL